MDSTFILSSKLPVNVGKLPPSPPPTPGLRLLQHRISLPTQNPTFPSFKQSNSSPVASAGTVVLAAAAAALLSVHVSRPPHAAAFSSPLSPTVEKLHSEPEIIQKKPHLALSHLLDSNPAALDALRSLAYRKLELGEDEEALRIIRQLIEVRPEELEWKFLAGRLLNEMGRVEEARKVFDEILQRDPLSFEALFENSVLMDRCGEGEEAMEKLRSTLDAARREGRDREARDVRLLMAQMQYLQKKVNEALESYEDLAQEDPADYRPFFCQGVIYTLLGRDTEAREKFARYKELSPRKFEVEGFVQSPLSRVKLFGIDSSEVAGCTSNEAVGTADEALGDS